MKQAEDDKAKRKIRVLKLKRETLRELDAGELKQAQGCGPTSYCITEKCVTHLYCTHPCR